jgi:hypothetical protein
MTHSVDEGAGAREERHSPIEEAVRAVSVGEALDGLTGDFGDEIEVLVVVENDKAGALGERGDDQIGDGARWCPRSAKRRSTWTARSSATGVAYSIGIELTGGPSSPAWRSLALRAE